MKRSAKANGSNPKARPPETVAKRVAVILAVLVSLALPAGAAAHGSAPTIAQAKLRIHRAGPALTIKSCYRGAERVVCRTDLAWRYRTEGGPWSTVKHTLIVIAVHVYRGHFVMRFLYEGSVSAPVST